MLLNQINVNYFSTLVLLIGYNFILNKKEKRFFELGIRN